MLPQELPNSLQLPSCTIGAADSTLSYVVRSRDVDADLVAGNERQAVAVDLGVHRHQLGHRLLQVVVRVRVLAVPDAGDAGQRVARLRRPNLRPTPNINNDTN